MVLLTVGRGWLMAICGNRFNRAGCCAATQLKLYNVATAPMATGVAVALAKSHV